MGDKKPLFCQTSVKLMFFFYFFLPQVVGYHAGNLAALKLVFLTIYWHQKNHIFKRFQPFFKGLLNSNNHPTN